MARETFESWIAEEYSGPALTRIRQVSAVERFFRKEPMATDAKRVLRSGGVTIDTAVTKGTAFPESAATNDNVLLEAVKIGTVVRVAQEDLRDAAVSIINTKSTEAASEVAVALDNAVLGVTAAANGTTRPYTSLYRTLRTTAGSYTADTNRIATASGADVSYTQLSDLLALVEQSRFSSDVDNVVIADPAFKAQFRNLLDDSGRPIFDEFGRLSQTGTASLLGMPIVFTHGAKASSVMSNTPSGNPLLFMGSTRHAILGTIGGWESDSSTEAGFLTHEILLKFWIRRAFAVAEPTSWAVLELTP